MSSTAETQKTERIDAAAALAESTLGSGPGVPAADVARLVRDFYRHLAPLDVLERTAEDLYGAVVSHLRMAELRPQGTALVRTLTPNGSRDGWAADGRTVIEVVTDDMPFLVDTVSMELARLGHTVHRLVHPQVDVARDVTGRLTGLGPGVAPDGSQSSNESWMHVEIDRLLEIDYAEELTAAVQAVLRDVREAVEDWDRMAGRVREIRDGLEQNPPPVPLEEVRQAVALLDWLGDDHFTFLGCRDYELVPEGGGDLLRAVPGTGLGILRTDPDLRDPDTDRLRGRAAQKAREKTVLVLAKANSRSTVHRPARLDYIGVKAFDENGEVSGERRLLGLFTGAAYNESISRIPVLREKADAVLAEVGFSPSGHAGKALLDTLETYPRDELFHTSAKDLARIAQEVMFARERRQVRAFLHTDTYDRYVSALVYLPRDRYNTGVRQRFAEVLRTELGGESVDFTVRLSESATARLHFVVHPPAGQSPHAFDAAEIERQLVEAARSWNDDWVAAMVVEYGEHEGARLAREWAAAFGEGYKEDYGPQTAAGDIRRLLGLGSDDIDIVMEAAEDPTQAEIRGDIRLKVYRTGTPLSLSELLPMISSLGVEVIDERPYEFFDRPTSTWLYEFGLRRRDRVPEDATRLVTETLRAIWLGQHEVDDFNSLVLDVGLTWRQVWVLRAYAKYMRQGNSPFGQDTIERALLGNPEITRELVALFETRFDPDLFEDSDAGAAARATAAAESVARIEEALDAVVSLDQDRILHGYLAGINATLRTNHYRLRLDGSRPDVLALKLDPKSIGDLPEPRPTFEIFVHSPRVEGVHLRFGSVARGGLRWSDRRDDFRTEVLGLVKAQMVKNTVIVPVGAKGGFYAKQLPDPAVDRDAWLAEGKACYRSFISGMLDVTDNQVAGVTVPPPRVVRHDGDDFYLVVAADKGTASFSDLANSIAAEYDFWLGDAFASGGSVGYDHKAMGITARGAWVSVQRHFRERGIDCQNQDFTCVGIGDMSGDVFGNGMLCSPHTRLVAAFDHRDIFLDPDPDAARSYAERKRLFDLPRSSWADYDRSLISAGGGVWSRSAKSVPVSQEVRTRLGLADSVTRLTPAELIRAILCAPVDLLWNGGIGTYVKGTEEQNADVGDKANDGIRVNGAELRTGSVGEGGNLGFTQRGRVEYARSGHEGVGGAINTDFIDNSAGVDTSDHEVNIKILLDRVVHDGELTQPRRNELLAEMTDEVAAMVLVDNYEQNLALANQAAHAGSLLHVHESWMRRLEHDGVLNRELEGLPTAKEVKARLGGSGGLTTPEASVLMAWTKIVLAERLLRTDLPEDPFFRGHLYSYFPSAMRSGMREQMDAHPLRRELVVTEVVNELVNAAGMTYWTRLEDETGAEVADLTRANGVAREIFGSAPAREELAALDNQIPAAVQTRLRIEMRTLCERASRWLVGHYRAPLDSEGIVDFYGVELQRMLQQLPDLLTGQERAGFEARRDRWTEQGAPADLANRFAVLAPAFQLLSILETAKEQQLDPGLVARVHFVLGERLELPLLVDRIVALPREDRWQMLARASLREDVHTVHAELTRQVLIGGSEPLPASPAAAADVLVAAWQATRPAEVERAAEALAEICRDEDADLSRLSVGARVVRSLVTSMR